MLNKEFWIFKVNIIHFSTLIFSTLGPHLKNRRKKEFFFSAAHCTEDLTAKDLSVSVGEHDVKDPNDGQQIIGVKQIIQVNMWTGLY